MPAARSQRWTFASPKSATASRAPSGWNARNLTTPTRSRVPSTARVSASQTMTQPGPPLRAPARRELAAVAAEGQGLDRVRPRLEGPDRPARGEVPEGHDRPPLRPAGRRGRQRPAVGMERDGA